MAILSKTAEIKKALGKRGKHEAGQIFKANWNNQWGDDFSVLVRNSVQVALSAIGSDDEIAQKISANTADSLAHFIDA